MKPIKRFFRAERFVWFVLGFAGAVVLMTSAGSGENQPAPAVGTYRIETVEGGQSVYLLDTRTGHLWLRSAMIYQDLGTPEEPIHRSSQLDR